MTLHITLKQLSILALVVRDSAKRRTASLICEATPKSGYKVNQAYRAHWFCDDYVAERG